MNALAALNAQLAESRGYRLEINTARGTEFSCKYAAADRASLLEALTRSLDCLGERHCDIVISRCDEPKPPMTFEQWLADGHTKD